jgi:hypothetical protein
MKNGVTFLTLQMYTIYLELEIICFHVCLYQQLQHYCSFLNKMLLRFVSLLYDLYSLKV